MNGLRRALWIGCTVLVCAPPGAFAGDLPIPGKIYDAKQAEELSKARFAGDLASGAPFWTPSEAEVRALEHSLPEFLAAHWPEDRGPQIDPSGHKRQYFGVTRNGRRLVFVNAFCEEHAKQDPDWSKHFVLVFDGGSCFFQVYYDPSANSFLDLRVNGVASRTLPSKALQLTWNSAFQLGVLALWHQPRAPQRPSAARATQLSAQSVGRREEGRCHVPGCSSRLDRDCYGGGCSPVPLGLLRAR